MEAAARGATEGGGQIIGILPGEDLQAANPYLSQAIVTGLGPMRNYLVVLNGDAAIAVGGGYGTLSEIALAKKIGRPVVVLGRGPAVEGTLRAASPEEAARMAEQALHEA